MKSPARIKEKSILDWKVKAVKDRKAAAVTPTAYKTPVKECSTVRISLLHTVMKTYATDLKDQVSVSLLHECGGNRPN
mgnify:CR=1 FL=1